MPSIVELSNATVITSEIASVEKCEGGRLVVTLKSGKEIVHLTDPRTAEHEYRTFTRYLVQARA